MIVKKNLISLPELVLAPVQAQFPVARLSVPGDLLKSADNTLDGSMLTGINPCRSYHLALLLIWINFNPSMDK